MDPARLVERIQSVDLGTASAAQVASVIGDIGRLNGWAAAVSGVAARRAGELESTGQSAPAADVIARGTKSSQRAAQRAAERGTTLGRSPELEKQLEKGRVSAEHADALSNAARKLSTDDQRADLFARDAELARRAASETPHQFARTLSKVAEEIAADDGIERSELQRHQATLSHGINESTGMGWIRADLHPDDYQKVKRRLNAEINAAKRDAANDGARHDRLAATALVDLIIGGRAKSQPPAELMILIDHTTITSGLHANTVCEHSDGTPLPIETARRHACNAKIIPAVLDSEGLPLDVGRGARHATPAQRVALRAMYRTCAIDGCERDFDNCEVHHIIEWALRNGVTDLANLLPLCTYHHHRAHEGRWRLELDPSTRELIVHYPDGALQSRSRPDMLTERAA